MKLVKSHKSFDGQVEFYSHPSEETKTEMNFSVFRPNTSEGGKFPCLIWLSGLTCTEENFMIKSGIQKLASEKGYFVICPDTSPRGLDLPEEHDSWDFGSGAGFYLDATEKPWSDHYRMESYLLKELLPLIKDQFPIDEKEILLSGHSMGGHGALTLGIKNPELFKKISAFSPIVNPINCPWGQKAFSNYLGTNKEDWKVYDTCELLRSKGFNNPIQVFQGEADEFLQEQLLTQNLLETCEETGIKLELKMCPGFDHSYYFVASFLHCIF